MAIQQAAQRIRWTPEERHQVFAHMAKMGVDRYTKGNDLASALRKATVETGVRSRPWSHSAVENERCRYLEWLKARPSQGEVLEVSLAPTSKQTSSPIVPQKPIQAEVSLPSSVIRPKVSAPTEPPAKALPDALEPMLAKTKEEILEKVQKMLDDHRSQIQEMLTGFYDSLMCYWDPKHAEKTILPPEYVEPENTFKKSLADRRPRTRRVLVAASNARQLLDVQNHFKNVEFSFVSGDNPRQVKAGGHYDLVVATRFLTHSTWDALRAMHGDNVVFVNGSKKDVVNTVRERFQI